MNNARTLALLGSLMGGAVAGTAGAAEVAVSGDITTSTTWTADNTYNLQNQVFVKPGATLTIEPGTVIASTPTPNGSGSLAVTRGGKIIAQGTQDNPIIFTSTADVATWDGSNVQNGSVNDPGDPLTGVWREAANEWGNLTIMGRGFVSNTIDVDDNVPTCDGDNISPMEGLIGEFEGDPDVLFGGGDDDDNSGVLEFVSIRYAGRVVGLGNELNGLSLGGVGRGTDINHVEIMNNVDDGIEIWGGTVNLKYVNIWNVGDDSFDVDQGWRGKAQFGLIVQGFSVDADQGSGVGDNIFEVDGAEMADAQPVTTATVYNFTAIGQPAPGAGDGGTVWRDGARVQYRNCIIMDLGEKLVRPDWSDFEGSQGYGLNGTLGFDDVWNTPFDNVPAHPNDCANPGAVYQAQSAGDASIDQGFLAEITDSVFFRNQNNAYSVTPDSNNSVPDNEELGSDQLGITVNGNDAPAKGNVVPTVNKDDIDENMPIVALDRQLNDADGDGLPGVTKGGKIMLRVLSIDPRAANDAVSSVASAPDDGFFTPANYRGGFAPDENWLCTWSAADAFGFVVNNDCVEIIPCPADLDGNASVGVADLLDLLSQWGGPGTGDLDNSGVVGVADLLELLGQWGECP